MPDMNLLEFIELVTRSIAGMEVAEHHAMERACKVVQKEARAEIGTYQAAAGPFPAWDPLSDATLNGFRHQAGFWIQGKEDAGYAPPDNPLLRTGEMRDSIKHRAEAREGAVGSDNPLAVYQELGTPNATYPIPPRSFLGRAGFKKGPHVAEILGASPVIALCGERAVRSVLSRED